MDNTNKLLKIFSNDPFGLLDIKPKASSAKTEDQRLVASFEEINDFIEKNGREPDKNMSDMYEMKLCSRLNGIRENPEKINALQEHDKHKLLPVLNSEFEEVNSVDDIFQTDAFGLLEDAEDIFKLKNIPNKVDMPEYRAARKPCKDFNEYEDLFKDVHTDLQSKKRKSLPFNKELDIEVGKFFILKGVMIYIAGQGKKEQVKGKTNARLRVIYENGTESDLLLRSLARELYRNGRRISEHDDKVLNNLAGLTIDDEETGYIYVLKSKSTNPEIQAINDLYKIGFSKGDIKERVKNAEKEPTYLMAPVAIKGVYQVYNVNPYKLEQLLHQFFGSACLNLDVYDQDGHRHSPREWFIAPFEIIEQAIEFIITGTIIDFKYDPEAKQIVNR